MVWKHRIEDRKGECVREDRNDTLQELYLSRMSKRAGKITLDPSLNCCRLVDATEL